MISVLSLLSLIIAWVYFFGPDQYYIFDPYVDTQWNDKFSPEKFDLIEARHDSTLVLEFLGQPLYREVTYDSLTKFTFTQDGKLMDKETPWYMSSGYAWCEFGLTIDSTGHVHSKGKGWRYD